MEIFGQFRLKSDQKHHVCYHLQFSYLWLWLLFMIAVVYMGIDKSVKTKLEQVAKHTRSHTHSVRHGVGWKPHIPRWTAFQELRETAASVAEPPRISEFIQWLMEGFYKSEVCTTSSSRGGTSLRELPRHGCIPPLSSEVAVYVHVCPDSYNIKTLKELNKRC